MPRFYMTYMRNIFKIIADEDPVQLEVGRDVLDMAIRIASYINSNFDASDFFTIGNTSHEGVARFLETLQETHGRIMSAHDKVSLILRRNEYHMLETVLWYGSNFGDDIPELELYHNQMWDIYHVCF